MMALRLSYTFLFVGLCLGMLALFALRLVPSQTFAIAYAAIVLAFPLAGLLSGFWAARSHGLAGILAILANGGFLIFLFFYGNKAMDLLQKVSTSSP